VFGQSAHPGKHLQGREIKVGTLPQPGIYDAVDFVMGRHWSIISRLLNRMRHEGSEIWQT
jgi:hypothetical protein